MTSLSILGTTIRQDAEGRFCLNDCHKAAGSIPKDAPAQWLRTDSAKKLVAALIEEGVCNSAQAPTKTLNDGKNNGTYACRELIYAYGEWISPAFHLTVIRAFDALVMGAMQPTLSETEIVARAFQITVRQVEELKKENAILTPKAEGFDRLANSIGRTNLREVGKALKIGSQRGIELLRETKWIFRAQNGKWHAYADKIDSGYVEVKYATYTNTSGEEISTQQVFVTPKGMARLFTRLQQH